MAKIESREELVEIIDERLKDSMHIIKRKNLKEYDEIALRNQYVLLLIGRSWLIENLEAES